MAIWEAAKRNSSFIDTSINVHQEDSNKMMDVAYVNSLEKQYKWSVCGISGDIYFKVNEAKTYLGVFIRLEKLPAKSSRCTIIGELYHNEVLKQKFGPHLFDLSTGISSWGYVEFMPRSMVIGMKQFKFRVELSINTQPILLDMLQTLCLDLKHETKEELFELQHEISKHVAKVIESEEKVQTLTTRHDVAYKALETKLNEIKTKMVATELELKESKQILAINANEMVELQMKCAVAENTIVKLQKDRDHWLNKWTSAVLLGERGPVPPAPLAPLVSSAADVLATGKDKVEKSQRENKNEKDDKKDHKKDEKVKEKNNDNTKRQLKNNGKKKDSEMKKEKEKEKKRHKKRKLKHNSDDETEMETEAESEAKPGSESRNKKDKKYNNYASTKLALVKIIGTRDVTNSNSFSSTSLSNASERYQSNFESIISNAEPNELRELTAILQKTITAISKELEKRENILCTICWQERSRIVILKCGHVCCCKTCVATLVICPTCRGPITSTQEIFL